MGQKGASKNAILLDEVDDKENSSSKYPLSERPTTLPRLLRSSLFRRYNENLLESVARTLFEQFYSLSVRQILSKTFEMFHKHNNLLPN